MKLPIGFRVEDAHPDIPLQPSAAQTEAAAKESVVLIRFPACRMPLSYYNDCFDLKPGDIVFVEGKYEGVAGRVEKVSTDFKIKIEDYKKVLSVADTKVRGSFNQACGHFITFERTALPYRQVLSWFKPVTDDGGGSYINYGEPGFPLDTLGAWPFSAEIMERGVDYYRKNNAAYLCLDGTNGRAIVEGTHAYEVRFTLADGQISGLSCDCPCGFNCKHEAAVLLQLKETLGLIGKKYPDKLQESLYFAIAAKGVLLSFAVDGDESVTLTLA